MRSLQFTQLLTPWSWDKPSMNSCKILQLSAVSRRKKSTQSKTIAIENGSIALNYSSWNSKILDVSVSVIKLPKSTQHPNSPWQSTQLHPWSPGGLFEGEPFRQALRLGHPTAAAQRLRHGQLRLWPSGRSRALQSSVLGLTSARIHRQIKYMYRDIQLFK